jgi:hypothetical protein
LTKEVEVRGAVYNLPFELVVKDKTVWVLCSHMPIVLENETCVIGWFYDITEQKKLEAQAMEEKTFVSTIVDNAHAISIKTAS